MRQLNVTKKAAVEASPNDRDMAADTTTYSLPVIGHAVVEPREVESSFVNINGGYSKSKARFAGGASSHESKDYFQRGLDRMREEYHPDALYEHLGGSSFKKLFTVSKRNVDESMRNGLVPLSCSFSSHNLKMKSPADDFVATRATPSRVRAHLFSSHAVEFKRNFHSNTCAVLEIDLGSVKNVAAIGVQGGPPPSEATYMVPFNSDRDNCEILAKYKGPRFNCVRPAKWKFRFLLEYEVSCRPASRNSSMAWTVLYKKVSTSVDDPLKEDVFEFERPVKTRFLRIRPLKWAGDDPQFRAGVYGVAEIGNEANAGEEVVHYDVRLGKKRDKRVREITSKKIGRGYKDYWKDGKDRAATKRAQREEMAQ